MWKKPCVCVSHAPQLSPKKTWEGFIGGFFATVVFGFIVSTLLVFYIFASTHMVRISCYAELFMEADKSKET